MGALFMEGPTGASPGPKKKKEDFLATGTVIAGRYTIERHLASGGMGRVYIAKQAPLGRSVALKVMHKHLLRDKEAVGRFLREAVAVSQLKHPNTITIFDYGEGGDGNFFIAMELLEGEPLSKYLERQTALPPQEAVTTIAQVGRSLAEAHRKGIVHRDLKPENVFLSSAEKGLVKVLDFGIAKLIEKPGEDVGQKLTRVGFVCGTPEYMSPEQARGDELTGQSDLYALAVVLYQLLAGKVPFSESSAIATVLKHQSEAPPPLPSHIPVTLANFVTQRGLAKDPADRPKDADAFVQEMELAAIQAGVMVEASGTLPAMTVRNALGGAAAAGKAPILAPSQQPTLIAQSSAAAPASRKPWLLLLVVLVLIAATASALFVVLQGRQDGERPADVVPEGTGQRVPPKDVPVEVPPEVVTASKYHRFAIVSEPPGAFVYDGDVLIGETPLEPIRMAPDELRRLTVSLPGYVPQELVIALPSEATEPADHAFRVELVPLKKLAVSTRPPGAQLFLGGKYLGQTPVDAVEVPPTGFVTLRFELEGYESASVEVDTAQNAQVEVALVAIPPATSPQGGKTTERGGGKKRGGGTTTKDKTVPEKDKEPETSPYKIW